MIRNKRHYRLWLELNPIRRVDHSHPSNRLTKSEYQGVGTLSTTLKFLQLLHYQ